MPGLGSFLFGKSDRMKQVPTMAPYQQQNLQQSIQNPINQSPLYGAGQSFLQDILSGSPESMQKFQAPHIRQFQEQTAPQIAERFAGAGTGAGAFNSSSFQNALSQAGQRLQENLASLQGNMQFNALPQALAYAQQPYSNTLASSSIPTFQNVYQPGNTGFLGGIGQGIAQGAGLGFGAGPLANYFNTFGQQQQQQQQNYNPIFQQGFRAGAYT